MSVAFLLRAFRFDNIMRSIGKSEVTRESNRHCTPRRANVKLILSESSVNYGLFMSDLVG